ncbi:hypothetical protein HPB51_020258 [Rhipicephalus microplus]|uniref:CCHC-type domain-containing protein n=1 Tax=Rhipicephalus microplus TaxID=6941 RepID=A0A9J6EUG0_RHIMP|nr:hypothetical protein HPB51_020258 [Rhipicephalus microplus]
MAADQNLEAQETSNLAKGKEAKEEKRRLPGRYKAATTTESKEKPLCFLCSKPQHKASDCSSRYKSSKTSQCWKWKKTGHSADVCPTSSGKHEASCTFLRHDEVWRKQKKQMLGQYCACNAHEIVDVTERGTTCCGVLEKMLMVIGRLQRTVVTVLRYSGSNTVVVKWPLVPDSKLTGNPCVIRLRDRSEQSLLRATVFIN